MAGDLMNLPESPNLVAGLRDSQPFNSLEAPIILGVAVVGLLVGCALYHMCYRKLCMSNQTGRIFYSRNRGPSTNELRTRGTMASEMFHTSQIEEGILRENSSSNSLPDYNDLPPSYSNATKMLPKPSKSLKQPLAITKQSVSAKHFFQIKSISPLKSLRTSIISSSSEDPPPAYDDCKEEEPIQTPA